MFCFRIPLKEATHQSKHKTNTARHHRYSAMREMPIKLNKSPNPLSRKVKPKREKKSKIPITAQNLHSRQNQTVLIELKSRKQAGNKRKQEKECVFLQWRSPVLNVGEREWAYFWRQRRRERFFRLSIIFLSFRERKGERRSISRFSFSHLLLPPLVVGSHYLYVMGAINLLQL